MRVEGWEGNGPAEAGKIGTECRGRCELPAGMSGCGRPWSRWGLWGVHVYGPGLQTPYLPGPELYPDAARAGGAWAAVAAAARPSILAASGHREVTGRAQGHGWAGPRSAGAEPSGSSPPPPEAGCGPETAQGWPAGAAREAPLGRGTSSVRTELRDPEADGDLCRRRGEWKPQCAGHATRRDCDCASDFRTENLCCKDASSGPQKPGFLELSQE
ncbi:hypothetical protein P7K49_036618 [Saguinus oedipus]|uniref:Uncharacterized protein n=1 Tax=Saguinus oedipus TaxID=9490 RepID=A0ABQ9TKQ4_SAGOE|nr:hypothetical protein P7K49_036618 [Saguinus oedipus]